MQIWPVPFPYPCPVPSPTGMPESLKLALGVLSGVAIGIILEPVRAAIQHWFLSRRIHRIVAQEVDSLALAMKYFVSVFDETLRKTPGKESAESPRFSTERFDYAHTGHRDVLYEMPSWDSLKQFYDAIKNSQKMMGISKTGVFDLLYRFSLLEERVEQGLLGPQFKSILLRQKTSNLRDVTKILGAKQRGET
jgi:hypothetical protein